MSRTGWSAVLVLALSVVSSPVFAETFKQVTAAPADQRVYDTAGVLSRPQRASLRSQLIQMERSGSAQGSVVVVRRVDGETIEGLAKRLANKWRLGSAATDRRFVIVVAITQRRWRLETNKSLRARISDSHAKELMTASVVPAFRKKQYALGLKTALSAIHQAARGATTQTAGVQATAPPVNPPYYTTNVPDSFQVITCVVMFLVAVPLLFFVVAMIASQGTGVNLGRNWGSSHNDPGSSFWSGSGGSDFSGSSSDSGGGGFSGGDGGGGGGGDGGGGASGGW